MLDVHAEVRARLLHRPEAIAEQPQVVHDRAAVAEQSRQQRAVRCPRDDALETEVQAVERIDPSGLQGAGEQPGGADGRHEADQQRAEQQQRGDLRHREEREAVEQAWMGEQQGRHRCLERSHDRGQHQQPAGGVPDSVQPAGACRCDRPVVVVGGGRLSRRAVPALARGYDLSGLQRRGMAELRAVFQRRVDVEHGALADERALPDRDRSELDHARACAVAIQERVLVDHRVGSEAQQVRTDGDVLAEDQHAAADPCPQRPQVQRVQRRVDEQMGQGVQDDERLDEPEAEVRDAPHPDALRLEASDQDPLRGDREQPGSHQQAATEHRRSHVDLEQPVGGEQPRGAGVERDADQP